MAFGSFYRLWLWRQDDLAGDRQRNPNANGKPFKKHGLARHSALRSSLICEVRESPFVVFLNPSVWRQPDMPVCSIGRSTEDQFPITSPEGGSVS
jgi:hypothetical protein